MGNDKSRLINETLMPKTSLDLIGGQPVANVILGGVEDTEVAVSIDVRHLRTTKVSLLVLASIEVYA